MPVTPPHDVLNVQQADDSVESLMVYALFDALNRAELPYAVLRNFEAFPYFGHDVDLAVRDTDLPALRTIFESIAQEQGWDAVTECHHWAQSKRKAHQIQVFRFS